MLTSSNRTNTRHTWASYDNATQVVAQWRGDTCSGVDWDFVAYSNHAAVACNSPGQVLRHVRWPASTPGGQHLRQWLATLPRPGQTAAAAPSPSTMTETPYTEPAAEPAELEPTEPEQEPDAEPDAEPEADAEPACTL